MKPHRSIARYYRSLAWPLFAAVVMLLAVAFTLARLWLPEAGQYREDIQRWVSEYTGLPVAVGAIHVQWRGLSPRLALRDICLLEKQGVRPVMCFKEAQLSIDLLASIWRGRPEPSELTVVGANLSVLRNLDGSFTIAGLEGMPPDPHLQEMLQQWLLSQSYLVVKNSQVHWRDMSTGRERNFTGVNLDLRNDGQRHRLSGAVVLPAGLGNKITFALDLTGNVFQANAWSGRGYVDGAGVNLGQWLDGHEAMGLTAGKGIADVKLWAEWQHARLQRLTGEASVRDVLLTAGQRPEDSGPLTPVDIATLSGRFVWQRQIRQGWKLDVDRFVLASNGSAILPATSFKATMTRNGQASVLEAGVGRLRLQDAAALLTLSNMLDTSSRDALAALQPSADLRDAYIRFRSGEEAGHSSYAAHAQFQNLVMQRWKNIPAVTGAGLSGALRMDDQSGVIALAGTGGGLKPAPTIVDFGTLFRGPLSAGSPTGHIAWRHQDGAWRVQANDLVLRNADLSGRVNGVVDIPDNGASPFLNLVANFENGNAEHTSRYLPVDVMPVDVVQWLDSAIVSGRVTSGTMLLHGRVSDFPYAHGTGRFEVRFNVIDGILDYAPGWPRLEEIETEVVFSGHSMELNATGGKAFDSAINQTHVAISDMGATPAILTIHGKAQGPTGDALRFVRESPLHEILGKYLDKARASGHSTLDLDVLMPLSSQHPNQIKGALNFDNSTLILADGDLELTHVNGVLGYTESSLTARGVHAQLLGQEAVIGVDTPSSPQDGVLRFDARGKATANDLVRQFKSPLLKHLEGNADWLATLRIREGQDKTTSAELRVESDLKGMAVTLPDPLDKAAAQRRALVVETAFPRTQDTPFTVRYGDNLRSIFTLASNNDLERGELRFGGSAAALPERKGLRIAGEAPRISATEWVSFMKPGKDSVASAPTHDLSSIDLRIGELEIFGQRFSKVDLRAENTPQTWRANIDSARLAGGVQLPHAPSSPVVVDLERLALEKMPEGKGAGEIETDPRQIPPIRLQVKHFTYAGNDFGALTAATSQRPAGLHLDNLSMVSDTLRITSSGDWVIDKGRQVSSFTIAMESDDLEKTFALFGHGGAIENGKGRSDIVARWAGAPSAFSYERLNGSLRLNFKKGRILGIEPGAGRVFGLLGTLNFNDLFSKGFTFDRIDGDFSIKDGNANTDNLAMEGPVAKVAIQGRVGLAAKDYDQRVTVTPRSSTTLPLAGALAGGLPLGAAVFLFQKLFQPGLDRLTRYQYTVKGSWDNPVIDVPVGEKKMDTPPGK
ncbi:MAG: TIGR02099 family protein [Gammaproteobacteria bacterium]